MVMVMAMRIIIIIIIIPVIIVPIVESIDIVVRVGSWEISMSFGGSLIRGRRKTSCAFGIFLGVIIRIGVRKTWTKTHF